MSKILKITMDFDDKIQTLDGEQAEKWLEAVNSTCAMEHIHGRPFPEFKWVTVKKVDTQMEFKEF